MEYFVQFIVGYMFINAVFSFLFIVLGDDEDQGKYVVEFIVSLCFAFWGYTCL